MYLVRKYIPIGVFKTYEELAGHPDVPSNLPPSLWNMYARGTHYLSVWFRDNGEESHWGYFTTRSLDWALEKGYTPLDTEVEEVLI